MRAELIVSIIKRELKTLQRELLAYPDEEAIWATPAGVTNSAGNLALHLVGNLRHFIGAQIGKNGYVRNRDAEFSQKNVPRGELIEQIETAMAEIESALAQVTAEKLDTPYPLELAGVRVQTGDFILHLSTHLAYHLGQIDYHRRLGTGLAGTVGALAISDLKTVAQTES